MKYDVVKEYDWCSSPRGSGLRKKAPRVWVKSYKLKSNAIMTSIKNYLNIAQQAGGDAKTFYEKMYGEVTTPEDDFNFPFFGDNVRSFSNTFGDTFQNGVGGGGGIGTAADNILKTAIGAGVALKDAVGLSTEAATDAISKFSNGNFSEAFNSLKENAFKGGDPGSYVETPQFYQFDKTDGPLEVSFVLSNTINTDHKKNYELVKKLTEINRPLRRNSIAVDPPRIYQVKVPGHRFIKWAYCSSFSVNLLGTKRESGGVIVPEGYQINMSFQSLTLEHAGFMKEV